MASNPLKSADVYFFGTCIINSLYPDTGLAAVWLLQRAGLQVIFPQKQSCCGQPAFNSGFVTDARQVARRQLHTFDRDYPIIVPSGSCAGMMKYHYPELFAGDPDEKRARHFAGRVFELTEFLTDVVPLEFQDLGPPLSVTWHSSCHAMREMGVTEKSKSMLRQLKHVELIELQREYECCGFGGTFAVKQPLISEAMVKDKIDDILKTGAQRVISGDCGCLVHIDGALRKIGARVKIQHIAEFLRERTHG